MRIRKDGQLDRRYFSKPPERREQQKATWQRKRDGLDCMSGAALVESLGEGGHLNWESSPYFMWTARRMAFAEAAKKGAGGCVAPAPKGESGERKG